MSTRASTTGARYTLPLLLLGRAAALDVWPLPQRESASGPPLAVDPNFEIVYDGASAVARAAAKMCPSLPEGGSEESI